jgi:hypothetical protein
MADVVSMMRDGRLALQPFNPPTDGVGRLARGTGPQGRAGASGARAPSPLLQLWGGACPKDGGGFGERGLRSRLPDVDVRLRVVPLW